MLKNKSILFLIAALFILSSAALAVKPRYSTYQSKGKFERGTSKKMSILHKGILTPAPKVEKIMSTGDPFIWSAISDSKGNIYLGSGNDGIVYKISAKGDTAVWLDTDELEVYALAADKQDNIYVGTSPRGKVYKVTPSGTKTEFYSPKSDYIWDMDMDAKGNLYVATGSIASIIKITPDGTPSVVMKSEQTHIRSIFVHNNTIYAGSSGNGYVYKIEPGGTPFVILDTQMQEVHDILVTPDGTVYAAAFGETAAMYPGQPKERADQGKSNGDSDEEEGENEASFAQSFLLENMAQTAQTPTALYRIETNGYAKDLWLGAEEHIQSLLLAKDGNILAGTGDNGKLYSIDKEGNSSLLFNIEESQITAMTYGIDHKLVIGTSNLGIAYVVMPEKSKTAEYESETIDTGLQSIWGTLAWKGSENDGKIEFYTRSGNTELPEQSWSEWQKTVMENGALKIKSPAARYVQWKCEMQPGKNPPQIKEVNIAYMQKNLPPLISDIVIHPPGNYYEIDDNSEIREKGIPYPQTPTQEGKKTGFQSVDWLFEDPNFDGILFSVQYCKTGSKNWKTLVTDYPGSYFSWDSRQMADGEYLVKVIATDAPSNPKAMTLTGEKNSEPFIIDNSGPKINIQSLKDKILTVSAEDAWNNLEKVYYSVNASSWEIIYPTDQITDAKKEKYQITIDVALPAEIAIKAHDNVGNVTVVHKELEK